ncbi:hypothetical protein NEFER03_0846 [Nematocida sp. LUAm3]|nr:hypothetical protein NEFER03_0846 [Nematocida sp. LUAm3]KAI5174864.1 hypothetical protein NEFER02_0964 [Nematocida sp. LUAm2]KAI5177538.1 hypothetical protein NEFER01_0788 [Nematocida sp. LUAm1]
MEDLEGAKLLEEFTSMLQEMGMEGHKKECMFALSTEQKIQMLEIHRKNKEKTYSLNEQKIAEQIKEARRPFSTSYTLVHIEACAELMNQARLEIISLCEQRIEKEVESGIIEEVLGVIQMLAPPEWRTESRTYLSISESKQNKPIFLLLEPAVKLFRVLIRSPTVIRKIKEQDKIFSSIIDLFPSQYMEISRASLEVGNKCMDKMMHLILKHLLSTKEAQDAHIRCIPLCSLRMKYIVEEVTYNISIGNTSSEFFSEFLEVLTGFYNESPLIGIMIDGMLRLCSFSKTLSAAREKHPEIKQVLIEFMRKQEESRKNASKIDVRKIIDHIPEKEKENLNSIISIVSVLYRINSSQLYKLLEYAKKSILEEPNFRNKASSLPLVPSRESQEKSTTSAHIDMVLGKKEDVVCRECKKKCQAKEKEEDLLSATVEANRTQKSFLSPKKEIDKEEEKILSPLRSSFSKLSIGVSPPKNLPKCPPSPFANIKEIPKAPSLPNMPKAPSLPNMPKAPSLPNMPKAPLLPNMPKSPSLPGLSSTSASKVPVPPMPLFSAPRAPGMAGGNMGAPPNMPSLGMSSLNSSSELTGPRAEYIKEANKLKPSNPQQISYDVYIRKPQGSGLWSILEKKDLRLFKKEDFLPFSRQDASKAQEVLTKKPNEISLLSQKKCKAIEISLARVRVPIKDLVLSIHEIDPYLFTETILSGLLCAYPSEEELDLIRNYEAKLVPEIFYKEALKIEHFKEKMILLHLISTSSNVENVLLPNLKKLHTLCATLLKSKGVHRVLHMTLAVINILNATRRNEGAWGIKVEALSRISENSKIMELIRRKVSESPPISAEEHELLKDSILVSLDIMDAEIIELQKKQEEIKKLKLTEEQKKRTEKVMHALHTLNTKYKEFKKCVEDLRIFLGEKEGGGTGFIYTFTKFLLSTCKDASLKK